MDRFLEKMFEDSFPLSLFNQSDMKVDIKENEKNTFRREIPCQQRTNQY